MVYVVISLCEGFYLYCPLPVMMVSCFLTGILGVTSYTIRISATQSYVPDEKKGRFNGAFNMLNTVGSFTGNLLAGALVASRRPRRSSSSAADAGTCPRSITGKNKKCNNKNLMEETT